MFQCVSAEEIQKTFSADVIIILYGSFHVHFGSCNNLDFGRSKELKLGADILLVDVRLLEYDRFADDSMDDDC